VDINQFNHPNNQATKLSTTKTHIQEALILWMHLRLLLFAPHNTMLQYVHLGTPCIVYWLYLLC